MGPLCLLALTISLSLDAVFINFGLLQKCSHSRRSLRHLSNQSCPNERMFCITLIRKDPTCPDLSESLLFHASVFARCVYTHLLHALDLQLHCFFT